MCFVALPVTLLRHKLKEDRLSSLRMIAITCDSDRPKFRFDHRELLIITFELSNSFARVGCYAKFVLDDSNKINISAIYVEHQSVIFLRPAYVWQNKSWYQ